jgi:hypothetical protein
MIDPGCNSAANGFSQTTAKPRQKSGYWGFIHSGDPSIALDTNYFLFGNAMDLAGVVSSHLLVETLEPWLGLTDSRTIPCQEQEEELGDAV